MQTMVALQAPVLRHVFFDGTPFKPAKELLEEELEKVRLLKQIL